MFGSSFQKEEIDLVDVWKRISEKITNCMIYDVVIDAVLKARVIEINKNTSSVELYVFKYSAAGNIQLQLSDIPVDLNNVESLLFEKADISHRIKIPKNTRPGKVNDDDIQQKIAKWVEVNKAKFLHRVLSDFYKSYECEPLRNAFLESIINKLYDMIPLKESFISKLESKKIEYNIYDSKHNSKQTDYVGKEVVYLFYSKDEHCYLKIGRVGRNSTERLKQHYNGGALSTLLKSLQNDVFEDKIVSFGKMISSSDDKNINGQNIRIDSHWIKEHTIRTDIVFDGSEQNRFIAEALESVLHMICRPKYEGNVFSN